MRPGKIIAALFVVAALAACATPYRESNALVEAFTVPGGYRNTEVQPGVWRVVFSGNGNTTNETIQTYWLYRCAELAIEKGFDGFEIVSGSPLVALPDFGATPSGSLLHKTASHGSAPIFIPMYGGPPAILVQRVGDIRLLHNPIMPMAGKVFDAAKLKAALDPYVNRKKCDENNVCTHEHRYLRESAAGDGKGA